MSNSNSQTNAQGFGNNTQRPPKTSKKTVTQKLHKIQQDVQDSATPDPSPQATQHQSSTSPQQPSREEPVQGTEITLSEAKIEHALAMQKLGGTMIANYQDNGDQIGKVAGEILVTAAIDSSSTVINKFIGDLDNRQVAIGEQLKKYSPESIISTRRASLPSSGSSLHGGW